jgi:ABC-type antimicrobial peptide transport system permease subunit
MKIPFKYTLRNFKARKLTAIITVAGISLVVFVFTATLMMAFGVEKTLVATGSKDNLMILRKSSQGEITSIIDGETQKIISTLPLIKKDENGNPLISSEPVVIINLEIRSGGLSNITVRGVSQTVYKIRPQIKLISGRYFKPDLKELIVGKSILNKFKGTEIGNKIKFAGDQWTIVGVFEAERSGFESEIWGDARQLLNSFNRGASVSTMTLKLDDINNIQSFRTYFETDKRLIPFEAKIEQQFFAEQSEILAGFIRILGTFITIIFSFGAMIGAMITMYTSVASRTIEIGTLRALGFRRKNILIAFLLESLTISIIGGLIGIFLASFLQFFSISTLNWNSFAELEFSFSISTSIIFSSLLFSLIIGVLGGFLPSVRAARLNIVNALRAG